MSVANSRTFSVAPMMEWTDRHCRMFHRQLTRHALLYTEMIAADAIVHGDRSRLLAFDAREQPVAIQLGGSDPARLAEAAKICEDWGYSEINMNVGCPSDRVQSGRFGACLMAEPELVADCVAAMKLAVSVPVTVKCRIGIDDQDPEEALFALADQIVSAGVDAIIVHARKAWLKGLSPKENRSLPPLDYDLVYRLKRAHPKTWIGINGGIETIEACVRHLEVMDGVMLGRAAYQNPWLLAAVDTAVFNSVSKPMSRVEAFDRMRPYIADQLSAGWKLNAITRHMLGLFAGEPGARAYRRIMTSDSVRPGATLEVLDRALDAVTQKQAAA
ncbi:MAG: tRNA dihydrouridine(20/20a) synthase DusA [Pseudomonadota bacterium]